MKLEEPHSEPAETLVKHVTPTSKYVKMLHFFNELNQKNSVKRDAT